MLGSNLKQSHHPLEDVMLAAALRVYTMQVGTEARDPIGELEFAAAVTLQIKHPIQAHLRTNAVESSFLRLLHNLFQISKRFVRQGGRDPLPSVVTNRQASGQMRRDRRTRVCFVSWHLAQKGRGYEDTRSGPLQEAPAGYLPKTWLGVRFFDVS